jgi:serine/threonine protein kinase
MGRRSAKEIQDWREFSWQERPFVRAKVPRGPNEGQEYTVAKWIADRYEVKRFFASGGCGLLLAGRDTQTETEVLIKTTLRYDCAYHAKYRDKEGFTKQLDGNRKQLETERRIMVWLRNQACNAIPNLNDYVYDYNPLLEGPHRTEDGGLWRYDNASRLYSEPYLIMEAIEGETLDSLLEDGLSSGMEERRALSIIHQVTDVLRKLHRPARMAKGTYWRLVYQDLKPANIILGAYDYATLLDLGGCQVQIDGVVRLRGAFTPGYCPPECGLEGNALTPAADCYTVGSTLFHLITGVLPTQFLSATLAVGGPQAVAHEKWDWRLLQERTTRGTYDLVRRCLTERPSDRPADATVLHDEIGRLVVCL